MKTALVFTGLVGLSLAHYVKPPPQHEVETKTVDADFANRQWKVLSLFSYVGLVDYDAESYKIGAEYDIEKHADLYTDKRYFEEFFTLYKQGLLPKHEVFSIFYEHMRAEAIALFNLFYHAKDFETFYKTACWAREHLNEYLFVYSFYIAVIHRPDCRGLVLPAPYELYPEFFTNSETMYKQHRKKQTNVLKRGNDVVKESDYYGFYSNYSTHWTYGKEEVKLSYFTEDVGLNAHYYYFHSYFPFWMDGNLAGIMKDRRGEIFYYVHQQLMSRYYMERLVNGLGEVPNFSWWKPIKAGYTPSMTNQKYPFIQRNKNYEIDPKKYKEELQFLDSYEKTFNQHLQKGHFKAYNQNIDFKNSKSINFVGNFWQCNADLDEQWKDKNYHRSYEMTARYLLSAAPKPIDKYTVPPYALNFYQTSLRDPMFWQLYSKILKYVLQYKEHLEPYTHEQLHYGGVKINEVHVDKMVTYFDFYEYDITNGVHRDPEEFKKPTPSYIVRQPRLNHEPFSITIKVISDVETQAAVKVFLGPKYDSKDFPISLKDNWMNFYELDWFVHRLTPGQNKIVRNSNEFFCYNEESVPVAQISKYLEQGKVPVDMSEDFAAFPKRLMLPKGTVGGFPFQLFVFVYPYQAPSEEYKDIKFVLDNKPFGYPLDRPVDENWFRQPNMHFEDVLIYYEGEHFPYSV